MRLKEKREAMEATPSLKQTAPHSADAEKSVLGSMLLDVNALDIALEQLTGADFFVPAHQDIFSCMQQIRAQGQPLDAVVLVAELEKTGRLKQVGGVSYVTDLSLLTPSAANVAQYIRIVAEHSVQRQLIRAGSEIARESMEGDKSIEQILNDAERRIYDISMRQATDTLLPVQETMYETYTHIGELMNLKGALTGISTGFAELDAKTSGLQKSDLIIIAGRPSMGKTSFAINIAQNIALRGKKSVVVFSLEMSREQLVMRMFSSEAMIDMQRIKSGAITPDELARVAEVLGPMGQSKLFIDDSATATVPELRSKCRRLKAREGLDLIVIDYLQLMRSSRRVDNRQQEISDITRSLKVLARELDVPIILLSQLSRGPDQRADHRPVMADLRESGAIEQDADLVILLYREQVYDEDADNTAEAILAKHRNGPTGTVYLAWLSEFTKFVTLAR